SEILVGMEIAEVGTARGELGFSEPELADGENAGEFEFVLPVVAVEVFAEVTAATGAAAGDHGLGDEVEGAGSEGGAATGHDAVFADVSEHGGAIAAPVGEITGVRDGGIGVPHGRSEGSGVGSGLRGEWRGGKEEGQGKERGHRDRQQAGSGAKGWEDH